MAEPWLSVKEIAAHLGVTKDTVYDWIADKRMPAHRVGRLWTFQAREIDEWVRSGGMAPEPKDAGVGSVSDCVDSVEVVTGDGCCCDKC